MKSKEEKLKQKQLSADFKRQEKDSFLSGLPMEIERFRELFDFLNDNIGDNGCDHTLTWTEQYLNMHSLPIAHVVPWLNENGGYCDCEVLFNVEEKFDGL